MVCLGFMRIVALALVTFLRNSLLPRVGSFQETHFTRSFKPQAWWRDKCKAKDIQFNRVFHYKPSILGYPYFWKHTYIATLLGTNISLPKALLSRWFFLFTRWDMLVSRRVYCFVVIVMMSLLLGRGDNPNLYTLRCQSPDDGRSAPIWHDNTWHILSKGGPWAKVCRSVFERHLGQRSQD